VAFHLVDNSYLSFHPTIGIIIISMRKSCFFRLGLSPSSTEKEIREAYRKAAIQVHPDKVSPEYKQQATIAFQELHEAYEECVERCRTGNASSAGSFHESSGAQGERENRCSAADLDIKKAFNDVCDELDREWKRSVNEKKQACFERTLKAWPDMEKCWNEAVSGFMPYEITELADHIRPHCQQLADYLLRRLDEHTHEMANRRARENRTKAEIFHHEWHCCNHQYLKAWVQGFATVGRDWMYIADMQPNACAARAIREWRREYDDGYLARHRQYIEETARKIIQAFPVIAAIADILRYCSFLDRPEIYALLPEHTRLALTQLA
jgi:hypothetical protein